MPQITQMNTDMLCDFFAISLRLCVKSFAFVTLQFKKKGSLRKEQPNLKS